jgi:hypothetical protein
VKADVARTHFGNAEIGLPPDRRLCKDGFIILAQAAIRADGIRPRKFGSSTAKRAKACALRAPTTFKFSGRYASAKFERGF